MGRKWTEEEKEVARARAKQRWEENKKGNTITEIDLYSLRPPFGNDQLAGLKQLEFWTNGIKDKISKIKDENAREAVANLFGYVMK